MDYIEPLLILISTVTEWVSISTFVSLVGTPIGITSSEIEIKICVITAENKKHKSIVKKSMVKYYHYQNLN